MVIQWVFDLLKKQSPDHGEELNVRVMCTPYVIFSSKNEHFEACFIL